MEPDRPLQKATCRCGHEGKSRRPEYYQCGYCYYTANAKSHWAMITKLEKRITKLREEGDRFVAKAQAFRSRHPRPEEKSTTRE